MRRMLLAVAAALLIPAVSVSAETAGEMLQDIIDEHWDYTIREFPSAAKAAGLDSGNDRLASASPESLARQEQIERALLERLRKLPFDELSTNERVNAELLQWVLEDSLRALELDLARIPFNTFSGFFMYALTASNGVQMQDRQDYEDYLAQLADFPRYFDENIANMQRGATDGFVLPKIVIDGVLPTVEAQVKDDPRASSLYAPFESMSQRLDAATQEELRERGAAVIRDKVIPAFSRLANYLGNDYPASSTLGAEQLPNGQDYYAFQIRRYTTITNATSQDIHAIGLAEVRRIRGEMQAILDEVDFEGSLDDFANYLRNEPSFYAETPEELLKEASYIAKRIDLRMPGFFGKLARQSYGIVPVPDEIAPNYTTGAYYSAPPGGDRGGAFWLNTYALDQRPLYELPALTLHEAVPGHHHQNALALEIPDAPEFRKNLYFSAYGEGWALYAERLGDEMGIYQTPYEQFGRLSYEMWRACRLVIDTGIHAMGWSREEALAFLSDNTSLSQGNIRAEVDRYISWPGQALSYKLGEIKIRELRERAEAELGDAFDLREFHDAVLVNGAMPLAMLERQIERYIASAR